MTDMEFTPNTPSSSHSGRQVFSVTDLNRKAKQLLEIHLPLIWVEGEISNFTRPSSGHWYFTLKDDKAQVRCAMFRNRNSLLKTTPKSGDQVQLRARVSLYEGRGEYQLIIEHLEEAGFGILQKRFQELKQKLEAEGLFEATAKKPIPAVPKHIAVVTSPTGAAVRDVISVLQRRFAATPITIIPSLVQGDGAIDQLCQAVTLADQQEMFDVILLCRGGGSIEDLWCFNSEKLARTIAQARTPVMSAVGHEIDFTIADFVADQRAATPSAAAELLSPDATEIRQAFNSISLRLQASVRIGIQNQKLRLNHARQLLRHPGHRLHVWSQRLDQLELRISGAIRSQLNNNKNALNREQSQLKLHNPATTLALRTAQAKELENRLKRALTHAVTDKRSALAKAADKLDIISPLNTLKRGYAITRDKSGNIMRNAKQASPGEELEILLSEGTLQVNVKTLT